jgi:UDP-sulfoquinovose synthase
MKVNRNVYKIPITIVCMAQNIFVLGGDGFCGWPTSLYLSKEGYNIFIIDNLSRRKIDIDLGVKSLTPIASIDKRLQVWEKLSGKKLKFINLDISAEYNKFLALIKQYSPKAILHFAEQRSAPYSMKSSSYKRYTVNNNTNATNHVLSAIVESGIDVHLIHLGTTGYYGYSDVGMEIPEGYLNVIVKQGNISRDIEIMYPPSPGSIYHLTKVNDAMMFSYYNKNDKLRITDLHQGIVWGTNTNETLLHEDLINRFDYDGDYGTVVNRFLMQAAVGHPLTVHGCGGQTRAFIHIKDTVKCIKLAIENPPLLGDKVKIFNQVAECMNVGELAKQISLMTDAKIRYYKNPRKEDLRNDLKFNNTGFRSLGWNPILLNNSLLEEINKIANKYVSRCDKSKIICTSIWTKDMSADVKGSEKPYENIS